LLIGRNPVLFTCGLIGAAVGAAALLAQDAPVYPVHGIIQDSISHQPIARVLVHQGSNDVLTDNEGRFELDLPGGIQQIAIARPGYRNISQNHSIVVAPGMPELTLELTPQISVSGQLALSSGEPADTFPVQGFRRSIVENNREQWLIVQNTNTSGSGAFRMPAIERGGNYIFCSTPMLDSVTIANGSLSRPVQRFGYRPTCYPGPIPKLTGLAADHNSANTLTLTPGQHAEIELSLVREPFFRVILPVLNANHLPAVEAQLHSASEPNFSYPIEWSSRLGYAEAYLPSGQYSAEILARGEGGSEYAHLSFHVASQPLVASAMTMLPLHAIPVDIRKDFTVASNRPGGERDAVDDPGVGINLVSADEASPNGNGSGGLSHIRGSTDPTQFQFDGVVPGRYWVQTYPTEGYVNSISSGGVDLTRQPLAVGPGNSTAPILVSLRNDVGHLQVTVVPPQNSDSEQTISAAEAAQGSGSAPLSSSIPGELQAFYVYAIPLSRLLWQTPQTQGQGTDPVTIDGLAPGSYCVVAFDHAREFNLNDPDTISTVTALGKTVIVSANGTTSVQLTIHHASADEPQTFEVVD
jgi:hypothetical protein